MIMFVLTYLIPLLVLAYCNIRIGYVLWTTTDLGQQGISLQPIELLIEKRKVTIERSSSPKAPFISCISRMKFIKK